MPDVTPRLGLKKPLGNENVTRAAYNENLDLMDANAAKKSDVDALRSDNTKPLVAEVRTSDPSSPVLGQIWLRSDL